MQPFYPIVLAFAIIALILVLTFMGVLLRSQNVDEIFPPNSYSCPDYWTYDGSGNCTMPTQKSFNNPGKILNSGNIIDLGANETVAPFSSDNKTFSSTNPLWSKNGSAICLQKNWANQNDIVWDGISNYNGC